jgi:nitrate/nitrite transport system ATP-binding protein
MNKNKTSVLVDSANDFHKISRGNSIEIKDITVSFKTPKGLFTAVKDINLNIKKGEIVALIGHSGCGKSTLMNTISGMVTPSGGEVIANAKKVNGPGPDRGIVFQNYSLLPWLSVHKNIYEAVDSVFKGKRESQNGKPLRSQRQTTKPTFGWYETTGGNCTSFCD